MKIKPPRPMPIKGLGGGLIFIMKESSP